MNTTWHLKHPMPQRPTLRQRIAWHRAHAKHCACRRIPPPLVALVNAAERRVRERQEPALRELLTGGDRRSIAQGERARRRVERDPSLVSQLVALTRDDDWLVRLRSLDILEKLAHDHPAWIEPHKTIFIGPLADSEQWEIRLQIVRVLPVFRWSAAQRRRAEAILLENVDFPQTFVRAWALDGLATFAESNAALRPVVARHLTTFEQSGSKALQARARQIRARMAANRGERPAPRKGRRRVAR
jgi:hypothetical protein